MKQLTNSKSDSTAVLILGHGSSVAKANDTLREIAAAVKRKGAYPVVQPAFLQFEHPNFAEAIDILAQQGVRRIIAHPYFLYMGSHVTKDMPFEIETAKNKYPGLEIILTQHLGYHEKLVEVAMERIAGTMGQGSMDSGQENNQLAPALQHPIEAESFRLISEHLDESRFSSTELPIVKRLIHTTADFEYADLVRFGNDAIEAGIDAILKGADIITDVRMVDAGISRERLAKFGGKVICPISDKDVIEASSREKITRTAASMQKAAGFMNGNIVVIGNAPTALREAIKIVTEGTAAPALVIGVPVGFVDAEESKNELMKLNLPHISIKGKKGGSTVAVAIVNALLMMAEEEKLKK